MRPRKKGETADEKVNVLIVQRIVIHSRNEVSGLGREKADGQDADLTLIKRKGTRERKIQG